MADRPPATTHPLQRLLTAGPRLGWSYQDPAAAMTPFTERQPSAPPPPEAVVKPFPWRRLAITCGLGAGLAVMAGCCGLLARGPSGTGTLGSQILLFAAMVAFGTAGLAGYFVWRHQTATQRAAQAATRPTREYQAALVAWQQRAIAHEQAEAARVGHNPVWLSAGPHPGATRLDIVGGTPNGWRDLLTVTGAGYLASHGPSLVLDLTGDQLATDLAELCHASGITVDWQTPPGDADLLTGLDSGQLVDVLVESVHGDGDRAVRDSRATDTRLLSAIVEGLGGNVTLARIADALRVLLRQPGQTPTLSATERQHLADELFSADYLTTSMTALQRLEAHLHPLRGMTERPRSASTLTIVGTATDGTSARSELLHDLILGRVTRMIATEPDRCRTLLIAGADPLPARQIERLADICHRQNVTLILLWRHLRDTAQTALGGGAVAFMRLRNGDEAARAADFIGRSHRFVLSGLTRTVGGSTTHTDSTGISDSVSRGSNDPFTRGGRIGELIHRAQTWTRTQGTTIGTTRTTSQQTSTATGDSWSDATSTQRSYEYTVEPVVLQGLPEHALLLIEHGQQGVEVRALDCNPAIVTLPQVAMNPTTITAAGSGMMPQPGTPLGPGRTVPPGLQVGQTPTAVSWHPQTELRSDGQP